MMRRPLLVLSAVVVAMAMAAPASATGGAVSYSLAASGSSGRNPESGHGYVSLTGTSQGCQGTGCATAPISGTVGLSLAVTRTYPPSPCRTLKLKGSLLVSWSDGSLSRATIKGRMTTRTTVTLRGVISTGTFAGQTVSLPLSLAHPPSPCKTRTQSVTGSLNIGT